MCPQVRQMLIGRAAQRITIEGIRAHAWLAAGVSCSSPFPDAGSHAAARRSRFSTLGPASLQACSKPHADLLTKLMWRHDAAELPMMQPSAPEQGGACHMLDGFLRAEPCYGAHLRR